MTKRIRESWPFLALSAEGAILLGLVVDVAMHIGEPNQPDRSWPPTIGGWVVLGACWALGLVLFVGGLWLAWRGYRGAPR